MIGAVLLAAGESKRMGEPKLLLPWDGDTSFIQHVIEIYRRGGVEEILVVTGGFREKIELELKESHVESVFNPTYRTGEMISSIKTGLSVMKRSTLAAVFISPADLPYLDVMTIQAMRDIWMVSRPVILSPSYEKKRGHPMLVSRSHWDKIIELREDLTLRDHFRLYGDIIEYLEVDDPGILRDIDTPDDYRRRQVSS